VVDGPGNRFVAFLQGCSFDCVACHNPQTIPPETPASRWTTAGELVEEIRAVEPFLSGVTVSGGEPTGQVAFVHDLFVGLRADPVLGRLTTFLDSNGHVPTIVWDGLLDVTDGVMLDLKALDDEVHRRLTGQTNELVLSSVRHLAGHRKLHEVRLLLIPGLNDDADTLRRTAAWLLDVDPHVRVRVNAFRRHGTRASARAWREATDHERDGYVTVLHDAGITDLVLV